MSDEPVPEVDDLIDLTAKIVAAYVSHNAASPADLPRVIGDVYHALRGLGSAATIEAIEPQKPAVSVRKSVTPDYLICLEDGQKFKSLRRHLMTNHQLTPEQYREKWGLPADYPIVAPNYSATRSAMAKGFGFGRRRAPTTKPRKVAAEKV